jgi:putative chitinase
MMITQQQIRRAVPEVNGKALDAFVAGFNQWAVHFNVNSPLRFAHFLSQVIWESNYLKAIEENLNYSADGLLKTWPSRFTRENAVEYARKPEKIANYVYANRMGNGNEASGDGWRYHGRGLIMLTGKEMYQKYGKSSWCIGDPVEHPEILSI